MNIYQAINAVMNDCGFIAKDSKNTQQGGYKFRGIDAVMNALNPALIKNKVFVVPEVLEQKREERTTAKGGLLIYSIIKVKYTFYAEDGSSISACVVGEGMDSGDKASNKAMSAAFKYACFQTFCIPTEEMKDADFDSPQPLPKNAEQVPVDVANAMISAVKVSALRLKCNEDGVDIDNLLKLYKVNSLEELTEIKHSNIIEHWDSIVKGYGHNRKN